MKVKVWNDNVHPYKEKFKGDDFLIPAKSFILMEEDDANMFKGTFNFPVLDSDGNHTPLGFKMIRIEALSSSGKSTPEQPKHRCMACSYHGANASDLSEHEKTHSEQIVVDKRAEEELASIPAPEQVKRKPGRPPKTSTAA